MYIPVGNSYKYSLPTHPLYVRNIMPRYIDRLERNTSDTRGSDRVYDRHSVAFYACTSGTKPHEARGFSERKCWKNPKYIYYIGTVDRIGGMTLAP